MSNRVIKISIVLIFMLFVTGLFNFCFALTLNEEKFIDGGSLPTNIPKFNINTWDGITKPLSGSGYSSSIYEIINESINNGNYKEVYGSFITSTGEQQIFCTIIILNPYYTTKEYTLNDVYMYRDNTTSSTTNWFHSTVDGLGLGNGVDPTFSLRFYYNYNGDSKWNLYQYFTTSFPTLPVTIYNETNLNIYSSSSATTLWYEANEPAPSISMEVIQTGTKTGHVEFTPVNWDSPHMHYVKGSKEDLQVLLNSDDLSIIHSQVKHYDGPIDIEYGEYVLGLLFDGNGDVVFSQISDSVTINYDILTDSSHKLYIDKENENIYYLSIHNYQDGDYLKVSDVPLSHDSFSSHSKILSNLSASLNYNGLFIGQAYDTALGHKNRKVNLSKNGITYFYLYDVNDNLINTAIINSSNYYSGEDFNFDVELQYGSSLDDALHLKSDDIRWVKVIPKISVPSIDNYELYLRIADYGNIPYIQEEDRQVFATHDTNSSNYIGIDLGGNSNTNWHRIDDLIYNYFYINTLTADTSFTFELQLRSGSGQIMQTKSFKVNLSASNKTQGTVSSTTDGKDDTYIRNPDELSGNISTSNKFDFSGLNDLSELDLQNNVNGLIDNSVGFFSLISTFLLLLPSWISALLYLFFFGIIVITLLRFIRGS